MLCVGTDRMMSQPLTQAPLSKGCPQKIRQLQAICLSSTHSDLRGGYEADHSITSEDNINADNTSNINNTGGSNKTTRVEATKAGVNNHAEGYYPTKDGKPKPS